MWKWIRLMRCAAAFIPGFAMLLVFSAFAIGASGWLGIAVVATFGLLLALVLGMARGSWLDIFFGAMEDEPFEENDNAVGRASTFRET